ncbi:MAG TPA: anti-sigma regulatory factor [Polyangia bacterium]|nr:anti-sigma regulatory factor [Polyangia bacterium]
MRLIDSETVAIRQETDLLLVRQLVRQRAAELGFRKLGQTKAVTAASELGRNTLIHGGGGKMLLQTFVELARRGLRLTFEDHGPGIADVERAMTDGYTTAGGLGLGLGGTKRLVDEFDLTSSVGMGTRVRVTLWT